MSTTTRRQRQQALSPRSRTIGKVSSSSRVALPMAEKWESMKQLDCYMCAPATTSTLLICVSALLSPIHGLLAGTLACRTSSTCQVIACGAHSQSCSGQMVADGEHRHDDSMSLPTGENCPPNCLCRQVSLPHGLPQKCNTYRDLVGNLASVCDRFPVAVRTVNVPASRGIACSDTSREVCALFCRFLI